MTNEHSDSVVPDVDREFAEDMNSIFRNLPRTGNLSQAGVSRAFSGFVECSGTVTPLRSNALSEQERKNLASLLESRG